MMPPQEMVADVSFSVLCSLKIDSGDYGKMQEENGLPEECISGDNNGTWWCKIIKNDDNSE